MPRTTATDFVVIDDIPLKDELGHLVKADHDEAELAYYEAAADPTLVRLERERRRYRGMFRRRLRH